MRGGLAAGIAAAALAAPASADAAADIEGAWSFEAGVVVVRPAGDGSFTGTIVRETRFTDCPHVVGEVMWANLRRQPDGQYWGGHQWFDGTTCAPLPTRGNTAFRVLRNAAGAAFLRVCFAPPERLDRQPTIAPDGSSPDAAPDCHDSALVAPPAPPPRFTDTVVLPRQGRKRCLSRRSFRIRLREPRNDRLLSASVFVNGRRVRVVTGERLTAGVNLTGLPKGRYTVRITVRTVLGRTISGTRRYRTCAPKRQGSGKIRV